MSGVPHFPVEAVLLSGEASVVDGPVFLFNIDCDWWGTLSTTPHRLPLAASSKPDREVDATPGAEKQHKTQIYHRTKMALVPGTSIAQIDSPYRRAQPPRAHQVCPNCKTVTYETDMSRVPISDIVSRTKKENESLRQGLLAAPGSGDTT